MRLEYQAEKKLSIFELVSKAAKATHMEKVLLLKNCREMIFTLQGGKIRPHRLIVTKLFSGMMIDSTSSSARIHAN